jgi:C4-dicarboxylate-specific signal transduction histidine kinase
LKHEQDLTVSGLIHDLNNVFQTLVDAADRLSTDPRWAPMSAALFRSVERGKHIAASLQQRGTGAGFEEILNNAITFAQDSQLVGGSPAVHFEAQVEPGIKLRRSWAWERVLINLFFNSMRAMPQGGRVHIQARKCGGNLEIRVRDEGCGIPVQILDSLFDPHVSGCGSGGLGLHVVQTIVKQDGGEVQAHNHPEGGAEFLITLPESAAAPRRVRRARA